MASTSGTAAPAASSSFEGIGGGLPGFTVQSAPPDTNGAVGPNHFVQTVNVSFAVFSKTGGVLYGPVAINTLFTGFGGLCAVHGGARHAASTTEALGVSWPFEGSDWRL